MLKEFKAFAMRGNVLDLAVGIIIGAAFGTIVKSLVDDVIMPPIGLVLGNVDFSTCSWCSRKGPRPPAPYATLADAQGGRRRHRELRTLPQQRPDLPHHCLRRVPASCAPPTGMKPPEAAAAAEHEGLPLLPDGDPVGATRCPECTSELKAA